jgi:hypothetical protein
VAHVEHAPSSFADYGKGFLKQFIENLFKDRAAIGFDLLLAVGVLERNVRTIGIIPLRLVWNRAETLLDTGAKLRCFGAELIVGELLYLRLKRVNGLYARLQALDLALVLRPENLA